jgi:hypothetical protein
MQKKNVPLRKTWNKKVVDGLAKTIDEKALSIYKMLLNHTQVLSHQERR